MSLAKSFQRNSFVQDALHSTVAHVSISTAAADEEQGEDGEYLEDLPQLNSRASKQDKEILAVHHSLLLKMPSYRGSRSCSGAVQESSVGGEGGRPMPRRTMNGSSRSSFSRKSPAIHRQDLQPELSAHASVHIFPDVNSPSNKHMDLLPIDQPFVLRVPSVPNPSAFASPFSVPSQPAAGQQQPLHLPTLKPSRPELRSPSLEDLPEERDSRQSSDPSQPLAHRRSALEDIQFAISLTEECQAQLQEIHVSTRSSSCCVAPGMLVRQC